jgi:hypothetical protein
MLVSFVSKERLSSSGCVVGQLLGALTEAGAPTKYVEILQNVRISYIQNQKFEDFIITKYTPSGNPKPPKRVST